MAVAGFRKCSLKFLPEITAIIKISGSSNTLKSRQIPCKLLNYNVLKGTTEMRSMNSLFSFIAQRKLHSKISNVPVCALSSSGLHVCGKPSSPDIPQSTIRTKATMSKSTRNFKTEASDREVQDRNGNDDIPSWVRKHTLQTTLD